MATATNIAGKIVVGTDGSDRATKAIDYAADRAVARGLELVIVNVIPEMPLPGRTSAASRIHDGVAYVEAYTKAAQERLNARVAEVMQRFPGVVVSGQLVHGHASHVLAQASKQAAMVVVGARGQSAPVSVKVLGGTSDAVTAHARGPITVISDFAEITPDGPVVVGVDDSAQAKVALHLGFEVANARRVPLIVINSWDIGPYDAFNADIWAAAMESITAECQQMVDEMLAPEKAQFPDVQVETRIKRGRPGVALVEASKGMGLMVVGSRGRGGFKGLLLGSTSKQVLREALCPVVVTHSTELVPDGPEHI
ncbi:hypothetical protein HMPREF1531_01228 [Propionibacterium sp. oral taxon 192 str. F0372]|uniref:universal stress protein n=1 Tax=Propionibacterium sp. oral taxon 192 TaxID=671222 RepID=UPI000352E905|nr:universal stress protein [Propionibacterium sp. oral taxon 192]EPH03802.1 hypothetical protein HMPREF1531_01228 [Propionibacterium sp. oral taxon 192 str. F0372]